MEDLALTEQRLSLVELGTQFHSPDPHEAGSEIVIALAAALLETAEPALGRAPVAFADYVQATTDDGHDPCRGWMLASWTLRTCVPTWLLFAGYDEDGSWLAATPDVHSIGALAEALDDAVSVTETAAVDRWCVAGRPVLASTATFDCWSASILRTFVPAVSTATLALLGRRMVSWNQPGGMLVPELAATVTRAVHTAMRCLGWRDPDPTVRFLHRSLTGVLQRLIELGFVPHSHIPPVADRDRISLERLLFGGHHLPMGGGVAAFT